MRTFEHFPKDTKCPVCGTNDDTPCILVPVSGTGDGRIAEAIPVHEDCIQLTWCPDFEMLAQRCGG